MTKPQRWLDSEDGSVRGPDTAGGRRNESVTDPQQVLKLFGWARRALHQGYDAARPAAQTAITLRSVIRRRMTGP
jgi:hypothetical protein